MSPVWIMKDGLRGIALIAPDRLLERALGIRIGGLVEADMAVADLQEGEAVAASCGLRLSDQAERARHAAGDRPEHAGAGPGHAFEYLAPGGPSPRPSSLEVMVFLLAARALRDWIGRADDLFPESKINKKTRSFRLLPKLLHLADNHPPRHRTADTARGRIVAPAAGWGMHWTIGHPVVGNPSL